LRADAFAARTGWDLGDAPLPLRDLAFVAALATLCQQKKVTLEAALTTSSNRDELQDLINRGVGVVAGAGLGRPGAPRPVMGR